MFQTVNLNNSYLNPTLREGAFWARIPFQTNFHILQLLKINLNGHKSRVSDHFDPDHKLKHLIGLNWSLITSLAPTICRVKLKNLLPKVPRSTCRPITPQKPPRKSKQLGEEENVRSHSQPAAASNVRERSSSAASVPSLSQKNFKVIFKIFIQ